MATRFAEDFRPLRYQKDDTALGILQNADAIAEDRQQRLLETRERMDDKERNTRLAGTQALAGGVERGVDNFYARKDRGRQEARQDKQDAMAEDRLAMEKKRFDWEQGQAEKWDDRRQDASIGAQEAQTKLAQGQVSDAQAERTFMDEVDPTTGKTRRQARFELADELARNQAELGKLQLTFSKNAEARADKQLALQFQEAEARNKQLTASLRSMDLQNRVAEATLKSQATEGQVDAIAARMSVYDPTTGKTKPASPEQIAALQEGVDPVIFARAAKKAGVDRITLNSLDQQYGREVAKINEMRDKSEIYKTGLTKLQKSIQAYDNANILFDRTKSDQALTEVVSALNAMGKTELANKIQEDLFSFSDLSTRTGMMRDALQEVKGEAEVELSANTKALEDPELRANLTAIQGLGTQPNKTQQNPFLNNPQTMPATGPGGMQQLPQRTPVPPPVQGGMGAAPMGAPPPVAPVMPNAFKPIGGNNVKVGRK